MFLGRVKEIVEATGAQIIPIDGKMLKGSYDRNRKQSSFPMVSAWASENKFMLTSIRDKENSVILAK